MRHFVFNLLLIFASSLLFFKSNAQSVGGTTSGSGIFCAGTGNGFISLSGYNGNSIIWQYSVDSVSWAPTGSSGLPSQSYNGLTQTTCYRAVVQDGSNPADTSTISCIEVFPPSVGGTITGAGVFCSASGTGTGVLTLNNHVGDVLNWEYSTDGGSTWTNVTDSTDTLNYSNLFQDRLYRAIVQSGSTCPTDTSDTASFTFDSASVAGILSGTDTICIGINSGSINLSNQFGSVLNWLSSSDNGSTWTSINDTTNAQSYSNLTQTTWYEVIVKNGTCPADTSLPATLTIIPNIISAGTDTTILLGESVILAGLGNGTALWTPSTGLTNDSSFTPTASPTNTTNYILTVTDNYTCISTDTVLITVYSLEFNGMVSNLFTPNGDGINDTWYIQDILNFPDNEVFVYNIYGNLVYNKKGYTNDWKGTYNGSELPDGTYYFVLKFNDSDKVIKGSLDILKNK